METAVVETAAVMTSPAGAGSEIPALCPDPVFVQEPLPGEDPVPVNVCQEAERDISNCNDQADCDTRCGEGKCHCLVALDCSEYPCSGSCRPLLAVPEL